MATRALRRKRERNSNSGQRLASLRLAQRVGSTQIPEVQGTPPQQSAVVVHICPYSAHGGVPPAPGAPPVEGLPPEDCAPPADAPPAPVIPPAPPVPVLGGGLHVPFVDPSG